jgi:hypothetical protein
MFSRYLPPSLKHVCFDFRFPVAYDSQLELSLKGKLYLAAAHGDANIPRTVDLNKAGSQLCGLQSEAEVQTDSIASKGDLCELSDWTSGNQSCLSVVTNALANPRLMPSCNVARKCHLIHSHQETSWCLLSTCAAPVQPSPGAKTDILRAGGDDSQWSKLSTSRTTESALKR